MRNPVFDIMKGFGILLVILGHWGGINKYLNSKFMLITITVVIPIYKVEININKCQVSLVGLEEQ